MSLVLAVPVVIAALGCRVPTSSSSAAPPARSSLNEPRHSPSAGTPTAPHRGSRGALGEADGVVPADLTVFDDRTPAVANLDPDLLRALRRAASSAARDDIRLYVNSGWRSRRYQDELLREAVSRYGLEAAAARWVATAATSPHVSGDAVDLGPPGATAWLSAHGAVYGLCQIYRNEPWHYEMRTRAIDRGCPEMYANPTRDPRMRQ